MAAEESDDAGLAVRTVDLFVQIMAKPKPHRKGKMDAIDLVCLDLT